MMYRTVFLMLMITILSACSGSNESADATAGKQSLTKIVFMTDWYPQPEHGGFYLAKANGYYREVGLDVEIRSGANLRDIRPLVASGQVDFAIGTSDTTLIGISRGLPLIGMFPYMQHDPQCIISHKGSGIEKIADLDGKEIMIQPSHSYVEHMIKVLGLDLQLIPLDFSLARFVSDKDFIQQCFVTSEPINLRNKGIETEVIMLSESGFDPYRHIYTSREFLEDNPEAARAFAEASIRGWRDFIQGDPTPALEQIMKENTQQTMPFMLQTIEAMKQYDIVPDPAAPVDITGMYSIDRLTTQLNQLSELDLIDDELNLDNSFARKQLPEFFID